MIGATYNTCLKADIVKRANVALRPYDQVKYANKLGTPARARPGQWISSQQHAMQKFLGNSIANKNHVAHNMALISGDGEHDRPMPISIGINTSK